MQKVLAKNPPENARPRGHATRRARRRGAPPPKSSAATEWKKKNTWFKADVLVKALAEIVSDPAVGFMQKVSSIDAAVAHGATRKDLQAWRKANEKDISTVKLPRQRRGRRRLHLSRVTSGEGRRPNG